MRRNILIALVAIILVAFSSCKHHVDPIHNDDPVDVTYATGFPLDRFHELGLSGDTLAQRQLVEQYRRQLTANVVNHYPAIQNEQNIRFVLGSGFAEQVLTGSGKANSGRFQNELIIIIDDPAIKDTVFLACGNGMLRPIRFDNYSDFGTAEQWRFTILPGEGLAHHLPELEAWAKVAGELSIPIKDKDGNVVSQEKYLNYLGRYESYLFPYDVVDVLAGKVYNQQGQEADFERRLTEAEKAAAHTAKATKGKGKKRR